MRRPGRGCGHHLRQSHTTQALVRSARGCRARAGDRRKADTRAASRESPSVAQLVRLLQALNLGFTRRQVAFGGCGEKLRSAADEHLAAVRRHDKELETEGVFMNKRTKLAIAAGAAIWMVPNLRAFAGIDITAGDWKVDFAGNVNAFYVGASCDNGTNTAVVGGLTCTGDHSAAVRNGLLPAALVF